VDDEEPPSPPNPVFSCLDFLDLSPTSPSSEEDLCSTDEPVNKCFFQFEVGASSCPHPDKRDKGGEDAYFASADSRVVGIADGVGGWGDLGVDPSIYSNSLMRHAKDIVDKKGVTDPLDVLTHAYENTQDISGSSTACVVALEFDELATLNVGDSGFMVIRDGEIVHRTKEQQYSFNYPYQLGSGSQHTPSDGDLATIKTQEGDLVIIGSDGLFDNLFDSEIVDIVNEELLNGPQEIADQLTMRAYEASAQKTEATPFAVNARKNGFNYEGGKMDDITVLVCEVKRERMRL